MPDHAASPTQDDLYELAVDVTRTALNDIAGQYDRYHADPGHWPHLAAALDELACRLGAHAAELSTALAAYAQAHPSIEVPDEPGVLLLTDREHGEFWAEARERADAAPAAGLPQYGEAVATHYGRPELHHRAVALDNATEAGAVMVLFHLAERGPEAVVLILIGGTTDREQIEAALAEHNITAGRPQFWPPLSPANRFISTGDPEALHDAYGRRLEITDPATGDQQ